jgi:hypothetical protein
MFVKTGIFVNSVDLLVKVSKVCRFFVWEPLFCHQRIRREKRDDGKWMKGED